MYEALNLLAVPDENRFQALFLRIAPPILVAHLCGNFACLNVVDHPRQRSEKFAVDANESGRKSVPRENKQEQEGEIYLNDGRRPYIFREMGVALQEPDNWVDQVCKKNGENKDQKDATSGVKYCEHGCKKQDGKQDVRGAAIGEGHVFTRRQPIDDRSSQSEFAASS
jgi:hypothetical protein